MVDVPTGVFIMGADESNRWPGDGESPAREIQLGAFSIARQALSIVLSPLSNHTSAKRTGRQAIR
jgi:hypothetical protein